jgi:hypothetical protein
MGKIMGERSKLDQNDTHPLFCPVNVLDSRMQKGTSPPKLTKLATQKVYVGHLHHYSKSVPMIWDPKTKLVPPQFHIMFVIDAVQAPDPNVKHTDTMAAYSKQIAINTTIPSEMNTHIYFLTDSHQTSKQVKN